jgi:hypothetical protein
MTDIQTIAFFLTIAGGLALGIYLGFKPKEAKGTVAKIPIYGNLANTSSWMPKNRHEWNILVGKVVVAFYASVAVFFPYMWLFVVMIIVYHVEWKTE